MTSTPTPQTASAETLANFGGVYHNADCFDRWAKAQLFWERMPYETRFYFGDGLLDYIQRGILGAAIKIMADYPRVCAERDKAQADLAAAQARIDALMLEYCPDEMTPERFENWASHQRRVDPSEEAAINAAIKKESVAKQHLPTLLKNLLDGFCYHGDSYGVDGSDFDVCNNCGATNGAGIHRRPFEHAPDCETARLERELDALLTAPSASQGQTVAWREKLEQIRDGEIPDIQQFSGDLDWSAKEAVDNILEIVSDLLDASPPNAGTDAARECPQCRGAGELPKYSGEDFPNDFTGNPRCTTNAVKDSARQYP